LFLHKFENGYGNNDYPWQDPGRIDIQPFHTVVANGKNNTALLLLLDLTDMQGAVFGENKNGISMKDHLYPRTRCFIQDVIYLPKNGRMYGSIPGIHFPNDLVGAFLRRGPGCQYKQAEEDKISHCMEVFRLKGVFTIKGGHEWLLSFCVCSRLPCY
jgi:hypothetical protein